MTGINPWKVNEHYPQPRMVCADCHEVSAAFEKDEGWTSAWAKSHSLYHGHTVVFVPAYRTLTEAIG